MAAPTIASSNTGSVSNGTGIGITLTNAPPAGGLIVVLAGLFSGNAGSAFACTATGGSGIVSTKRLDPIGATTNTVGVQIYTVEYSTAPTALTVQPAAPVGQVYGNAVAVNLTGQAASYLDGVSTGTTGNSTTATDTNLPDLTDANSLVLGVMTRDGTTGTIAPATNWTELAELDEANATTQTTSVIYRAPGSTGSFDPGWTISSADVWHVGGISIKGTAGGGGGGSAFFVNILMRELLERAKRAARGQWQPSRGGVLVPAY